MLVIPPIIDDGYWIYDFSTNGKQVNITVDSSRDGYSDRRISRYSCKGIAINKDSGEDGKTRKILEATSCEGSNKIDSYKLFVLENPRNM